MYKASHLMKLFNVSRETIRKWTLRYGNYLSPTANRENEVREFSDDDVRVLSAIHELRLRNTSYENIDISIANGYRADPPEMPAVLAKGNPEREINHLQKQIEVLTRQMQQMRVETVEKDGTIEELRRQLNKAENKIDKLNREIGKLEAKLDHEKD